MRVVPAVFAAILLAAACLPQASQAADAPSCTLPQQISSAPCPIEQLGPRMGKPKDFDYYLLALSWSPSYCAGRSGPSTEFQCQLNHFGFVVHGLWPQYAANSGRKDKYPRFCTTPTPVPSEVVKASLCTVPGEKLIQCQWANHGTCSDFDQPAQYYGKIRQLTAALTLPKLAAGRQTAGAIAKAVADANKSINLPLAAIRVASSYDRTTKSQIFSEIRLCYSRDLTSFIACDASVGGAKDTAILSVPPAQ